jgi:hypothetical protein
MPLWCIVLCFINPKQNVHALVATDARSGNITYSPGGDGKASAPDCKVLEITRREFGVQVGSYGVCVI